MADSGIQITKGLVGTTGAVGYAIIGGDTQILNLKLNPNEDVKCEPGVLMHMEPGILPYTSYACSMQRWCGGEGQWKTHFVNESKEAAIIGITPNRPGKVVPVEMAAVKAGGADGLYCKQGAWMASTGKVHLTFSTECNPAKCCCAGQGLIRLMLTGNGTAFLEGHGTVMTKILAAGEKIVVDQESVLAWASTVNLSFRRAGTCCTVCCSGEGLFNAILDGGSKGGIVVLESMPFSKYRKAILNPSRNQRGAKTNNV